MSIDSGAVIEEHFGKGWTRTLTIVEVDEDGNETVVDLSAFDGTTIQFLSQLDFGEGTVFTKNITADQNAADLGNGIITVTLTAAEFGALPFIQNKNFVFQVRLDDGAGDERYYPKHGGSLIVLPIIGTP